MPTLNVVISPHQLHEHAPALQRPGGAVDPGVSYVLDEMLQWICSGLILQVDEHSQNLLVRQEC